MAELDDFNLEDTEEIDFKTSLKNIWQSKKFHFFIDIIRIFTLIFAVLIFFELISEIEAVKILNYDVCKICMNKTGCECWCGNYTKPDIPEYNTTEWKNAIKGNA